MSDESPLPRKKRRWLRRLLIVCGILGVAGYLLFRDEALQPVDDLMPKRPGIAWDNNNGWKRLAGFAHMMPKIEPGVKNKLTPILDLDREPDLVELKKYTLTESQLAELESIAAAPLFQCKQFDDASDGFDDLLSFAALGNYLNFTLLSATEESNSSLILRTLRLSLALQKKQSGGATSLLGYFGATAWIKDAAVARMLVRLDWSEPDLKDLAAILADDPVGLEDVREAMSQEFELTHRGLQKHAGAPPDDDYRVGSRVPRILYQKNRTVNLLAKFTRQNLELALLSPWAEIRARQELQREESESFLNLLDPNLYGRRFLDGYGSPGAWEENFRRRNAKRRAMQVIVALHRYQKALSSLPATLEALTPEFLPAVPLDPFNFEPLQWNPVARAVQYTTTRGTLSVPDPKQVKLISSDETVILFRTKAEEDLRRASVPPPKPPKSTNPGSQKTSPKTAAPAPGGGANK